MKKLWEKDGWEVTFSILLTITYGLIFNAVQSNTMTIAIENFSGMNRTTSGLIIVALSALVIYGGMQRIAKVSEIIVPLMGVSYLLVAIFVVIKNISLLPSISTLIITNAFGLKAFGSATLGMVIMQGVKRGLFL